MDNTLDLFKTVSRDERQDQCRRTWIKNKCCGTIVGPTGIGKTRIAFISIESILAKYPNFRVIVAVPTETLRNQWQQEIDSRGLSFNVEVYVLNTIIKHQWKCNILVLDEIHRSGAPFLRKIFECVQYTYILGLTATFERLDGQEIIISKYCPVIDTITLEEALANGWISQYREYLVLLDVDDLETYKQYNKEFTQHFEFFNFNFNLAMKMVGKNGYKARVALRDQLCSSTATREERANMLRNITYHAMEFMKVIQKRKVFINNHPKKVELAQRIIEARRDKKIITFSKNVKMAEAIGYGEIYTGKTSKKRGVNMINAFNKVNKGVINTCEKANEGLDVRGLSVAIILGLDSSKTKAIQRLGRTLRFEKDKVAEVFNIVINNSVELEWFKKSHEGTSYITIDEANLYKVLNNEEYETYKKPVPKLIFRF